MVCVSWNLGFNSAIHLVKSSQRLFGDRTAAYMTALLSPLRIGFGGKCPPMKAVTYIFFQPLLSTWGRSSGHANLHSSRRGSFSLLRFCGSTVWFVWTKLKVLFVRTPPSPPGGIIESQGKPRHSGNAPCLRFAKRVSELKFHIFRGRKIWMTICVCVISLYFSNLRCSDLLPYLSPPFFFTQSLFSKSKHIVFYLL